MNAKRFTTRGIVLSRTNFGEADRILTFITPDHGKIRLIAKGSRKAKSKLAAGIEPFSISDLTVLAGKGDISTLMSSRLVKHYGNLSANLERLKTASAVMRLLDKNTEDDTEEDDYKILRAGFEAINNLDLEPGLVELWFGLRFLKLHGRQPNLRTDVNNQKLESKQHYNFDFDKMAFFVARSGKFDANHIKFLRLVLGLNKPEAIARVHDWQKLYNLVSSLTESMLKTQLRV